MLGLQANISRIRATRAYDMALGAAAAQNAESMLSLAEAAGVPPAQLASARLNLIHEQAKERAAARFGGAY